MWFCKERLLEVINISGFGMRDLMIELGVTYKQLWQIIDGTVATDRRQSERLLALFGIWSVCWAMRDNYKWLPYALEVVAYG